MLLRNLHSLHRGDTQRRCQSLHKYMTAHFPGMRLYKVPVDKTPNNISFVCNSHYIHCLIKELGTHLATPHTLRRHLRKRKSWTILGLVCVPLEFQPMIQKWIFRHATGFLKLHKCSQLYCWVYQLFHETSFQIIIIHSISSQSRASELLCHYLLKWWCTSDVDSAKNL